MMKFGWTWMTIATGALLLSGWGKVPGPGPAVVEAQVIQETSGCAAEEVRWSYDVATGTLSLTDGRVKLNCCGQRSLQIERLDGVLEVIQQDRPGEGGRCASACAYDLAMSISDVPSGELFVKLLRDVTDEGGSPVLVWQGNLELSKGSGTALVEMESAAAPQCQVAAR